MKIENKPRVTSFILIGIFVTVIIVGTMCGLLKNPPIYSNHSQIGGINDINYSDVNYSDGNGGFFIDNETPPYIEVGHLNNDFENIYVDEFGNNHTVVNRNHNTALFMDENFDYNWSNCLCYDKFGKNYKNETTLFTLEMCGEYIQLLNGSNEKWTVCNEESTY